MVKRRRRKGLSAINDNPREIFKLAQRELANAQTRLDKRQAAEKAHLALSSAIEVATSKTIESYSDEVKAVRRFAAKKKLATFEREYRRVRQALHGSCFHQDRCSTIEQDFGAAELLLSFLLEKRRR